MVDRAYMRRAYGDRLTRIILTKVSMIKRGGNGAHLYWKRGVQVAGQSERADARHAVVRHRYRGVHTLTEYSVLPWKD